MRLYQQIIFEGHVPSKKNNKIMTGRGKFIPGKSHEKWYKQALEKVSHAIERMQAPVSIRAYFFVGSMKEFDMSNSIESVNDFFVDVGGLCDDNCFDLQILHCEFMGIDIENPRVIVDVESIPHNEFQRLLKYVRRLTADKPFLKLEVERLKKERDEKVTQEGLKTEIKGRLKNKLDFESDSALKGETEKLSKEFTHEVFSADTSLDELIDLTVSRVFS